ncbi:hypothetical protein HHK36_023641 [Tetracentron sinense]|uniref:Proton pump-interactor 1 n=1 Tax=Tetracentron sinense TaxID=13715 RepID=A0A835D835_TETSI|nr:hypothetical protein HHK36_023641 [Tetracentron sinense]
MGVEVLVADFTQEPIGNGSEGDSNYLHEKDNGKLNQGAGLVEPIIFGSYGTDEPVKVEGEGTDGPVKGEGNGMDGPVKGEGDPVVEVNYPKDVVDEWPAPKQIHYFYFVKFRSHEDPKLKSKIELADKEIQKKNQARFQITGALKAKRVWQILSMMTAFFFYLVIKLCRGYSAELDRAHVISQLKPLSLEDKQFRMIIDGKRKEMEPLHQALGKLRSANNESRERGVGLCSTEEELNDLIKSLHYQMQHESNTLVEEKQLLREIKQFEGTREKVIANAVMRARIQDSMGQREAIQDQVKLIGVDLDGVRKDQQAIRSKIKHLEEELKAIDNGISLLQEELIDVNQKRDKAYNGLLELRKQRDEGNACYYQNRSLLNNARELAAKRDIAALEELSHTETEKFMSLWSSSKAFRDNYERRILPSLDNRQLSRDGRMRNPGEKPLVSEAPIPTEPEIVAKTNIKRPEETSKPSPQHNTIPIRNVLKEDSKKLTESETTLKVGDNENKEIISGFEKLPKDPSTANGVDASKLKEIKREEEVAKAKLALERKKKLAEKAAAKAAIRAQKEAEKKLKEIIILIYFHGAKKKAAASLSVANAEEQTEADTETVEPEKANANVEAPVPSKIKDQKENTIRYRNRSKGQDPFTKVILKQKKSTPYWLWAAPAALLVLMLAALGYYYLF